MKQAYSGSGLNPSKRGSRALVSLQLSSHRAGFRTNHRELEQQFAALQKDYAELHTALFEAARVHRLLCAPRLIRRGDFEIASEIFAVRHLPGDFVTLHDVDGGVVLSLGDISGKGLAAGMWTTHLVGLVRSRTTLTYEPQAIATSVNRELCSLQPVGPMASLFVAKLNPQNGRLDYTSAGHPPVLLLRKDGSLESLSEGGPLLGALPGASFAQGQVELGPDDLLLAYSDGIVESRDQADQEFGFERLKWQVRQLGDGSADRALFSVLGAVQDFAAGHPLEDDMSLLAIRRCHRRQGL